MTNVPQPLESTALPEPVKGVARGGHGTGTALDDTQVYDVVELAPGPSPAPTPAGPSAVEAVPAVAAVPRAAPRPATRRRASSDQRPRVGAPLAGLVGFALAAALAVIIGASLGGMTDPGGAANGGATPETTAEGNPAATEANDDDGDNGDNGKGCNGNGNGRGNCDDD